MAYTSLEKVQSILGSDTIATPEQITSLINAAHVVISNTLGSDTTLSAAQLEEIERWYTAHLVSLTVDRQAQRIEIGGDTNEEYAKLGKNLEATTYGQTVLMLDTTGKLASLARKRVSINAVTSFTTY